MAKLAAVAAAVLWMFCIQLATGTQAAPAPTPAAATTKTAATPATAPAATGTPDLLAKAFVQSDLLSAPKVSLGRWPGCLAAGTEPKAGAALSFAACPFDVLHWSYNLQVKSDSSSPLKGLCLTDMGAKAPVRPSAFSCTTPGTPAQQWSLVASPAAANKVFLRSKSGLCLGYDATKSVVLAAACGSAAELEFSTS